MVSLTLLDAHPKNPRIRHDPEFISGLAEAMKDGFDPVYAPTVRRKAEGRFEIIIGHRRTLAAEKAGLTEIPVKVVDWPEDKVLRELAFSNDQDRLSPLEIAIYSFEVEAAKGKKGGGLKEFASRWRLADSTLGRYRKGAKVYLAVKAGTSENVLGGLYDRVEHLAKIAEAPEPIWQQLVERLVAEDWSIKKTEHFVKEDGSPTPAPAGPVPNDAKGDDEDEDQDEDDEDQHDGEDEEAQAGTVKQVDVDQNDEADVEATIISSAEDFLEKFSAVRASFAFPASRWGALVHLVDREVPAVEFVKALRLCARLGDLEHDLDVCPDKRGREARQLKTESRAVEKEFEALISELTR